MHASDNTLTSTLPQAGKTVSPLLAITILWHPEPERAGEQAIGPGGPGTLAISRFAPVFQRPGGAARPLEYRGVAREAMLIVRHADDALTLTAPASRMAVEVNGQPLGAGLRLARADIDAGVVLRLGGQLIVCLHWMHLLPNLHPVMGLHGVSSAMLRLRNLVRQVAATDLPVLLLGETGSGKEVAANAIHACGSRRDGPFVAVNMATLSEGLAGAELFGAARGAYTGAAAARSGLFAEAAGGTLFLDEIGDAPAPIQPMLLRVLECGEYRPLGAAQSMRSTARVIAATDRDLAGAAPDRPPFNQPLLRRLETFVIELPALRERREDLGLLMVHFLDQFNAQLSTATALPAELAHQFCLYHWPGNVRQLANVLRRALLVIAGGQEVSLELLVGSVRTLAGPGAGAPASAAGLASEERGPRRLSHVSDEEVVDAMERSGWRILGAARLLGVSRPSMYKLLAANRLVRAPEKIAEAEIRQALAHNDGDLERCAAALKTPSEALRRHVGQLDAAGQA